MTDQLTKTGTPNMEKDNPTVSVHKIAKAFQKMHKGLVQYQLDALEKELLNMYPSEESEVMIFTDYDEEENSIGVGLYVSKAIQVKAAEKIDFDQLMLEFLKRMDISRMAQLYSCIGLMERKEGTDYELDLIPVHYSKNIDKHTINFRIFKK